MIPGRSGASDLGGSPCQQQGGFGAVPSLGCLHSLPLCLQVTVTYLSLPELPVSLKVTHRPQLLPVSGKLPSHDSPLASAFLPATGPALMRLQLLGRGPCRGRLGRCRANGSFSVAFPSWPVHWSAPHPRSGSGSCLDFSAE